jgi:hypothetical protein
MENFSANFFPMIIRILNLWLLHYGQSNATPLLAMGCSSNSYVNLPISLYMSTQFAYNKLPVASQPHESNHAQLNSQGRGLGTPEGDEEQSIYKL